MGNSRPGFPHSNPLGWARDEKFRPFRHPDRVTILQAKELGPIPRLSNYGGARWIGGTSTPT
eukprot:scaffold1401_cov330-Pavlova_lutheri.AAC.64